jgi:hypothetical protein
MVGVMSNAGRFWLTVACVGAAACASGSGIGRPIVEFPSQATLATVEGKQVDIPTIPAVAVPVEGWTVDPTPGGSSAADAWSPQGPWEEAFATTLSASGRKLRTTRAMSCAAREIGRFVLEHHGPPPEQLQRFIGAACGVFAPGVGYQALTGTAGDGISDERVLASWHGQLGKDLLPKVPADARTIGFWSGRRKADVLALVMFETSPVELKPFSLVPDANGDVVIEGRIEGGVGYFEGSVNQGRFGVEACLVDPAVPRPAFRITCNVDPDDETAWIALAYAPQRSVLAMTFAEVLARHDLTRPLLFTEAHYSSARQVTDAAGFAAAALAGLNAARAEAGLAPVRLAEAESATAGRLARQYFAASLSGGIGDMNMIALGLLAGWQVAGTIRDGTFFSVMLPNTTDAGRWLDTALAMPMGRAALLAREIEEVALGPTLLADAKGVGSIVCGYRFHHSLDHSADVLRLRQRLEAARKRLGLSAPQGLPGVPEIVRNALDQVRTGSVTPEAALNASLQDAVQNVQAEMRGYILETTSLDALEIPPEIIARPNLRVEIGVTHYKPPGAAWAQLMIFVIYSGGPVVEA